MRRVVDKNVDCKVLSVCIFVDNSWLGRRQKSHVNGNRRVRRNQEKIPLNTAH